VYRALSIFSENPGVPGDLDGALCLERRCQYSKVDEKQVGTEYWIARGVERGSLCHLELGVNPRSVQFQIQMDDSLTGKEWSKVHFVTGWGV